MGENQKEGKSYVKKRRLEVQRKKRGKNKNQGEESGHSCVGQIQSSEDFVIIGSWSCLVDLHSQANLKLSSH